METGNPAILLRLRNRQIITTQFRLTSNSEACSVVAAAEADGGPHPALPGAELADLRGSGAPPGGRRRARRRRARALLPAALRLAPPALGQARRRTPGEERLLLALEPPRLLSSCPVYS